MVAFNIPHIPLASTNSQTSYSILIGGSCILTYSILENCQWLHFNGFNFREGCIFGISVSCFRFSRTFGHYFCVNDIICSCFIFFPGVFSFLGWRWSHMFWLLCAVKKNLKFRRLFSVLWSLLTVSYHVFFLRMLSGKDILFKPPFSVKVCLTSWILIWFGSSVLQHFMWREPDHPPFFSPNVPKVAVLETRD